MSNEEIKVGDMVFYPEAPEVYYKVVGAHNDLLWVVYEKNGHYRTAMRSEVKPKATQNELMYRLVMNKLVVSVSTSKTGSLSLKHNYITLVPSFFDKPSLNDIPVLIEDLIALWDDVRPLVVDECAKKTWVPCEKDGGK